MYVGIGADIASGETEGGWVCDRPDRKYSGHVSANQRPCLSIQFPSSIFPLTIYSCRTSRSSSTRLLSRFPSCSRRFFLIFAVSRCSSSFPPAGEEISFRATVLANLFFLLLCLFIHFFSTPFPLASDFSGESFDFRRRALYVRQIKVTY